MISTGKSYMVFKPKEKTNSNGDRIVSFSIGNSSYNKALGVYDNKGFVNVIAITNQEIADRERVIISKINSIDTNEYNGKQSVTIFVELEGELGNNYEPVSEDELPF